MEYKAERAIFSANPIVAENALEELMKRYGIKALELVLQEANGAEISLSVEKRLGRFGKQLGEEAIGPAVAAIEHGSWDMKHAAAPIFAGFDMEGDAAHELYKMMERNRDIDARRLAIKALGHLGRHWMTYDIMQIVVHGRFVPGSFSDENPDRDALDNFASYAFETFARFIPFTDGSIFSDHKRKCFTAIDDLLKINRTGIGNLSDPDSTPFMMLERGVVGFKAPDVDLAVSEWLSRRDVRFRRLALHAMKKARLFRTAPIALKIVLDSSEDSSVRYKAAEVLAALRNKDVAEQVAKALTDYPDNPYLLFVFASLYPIDVEWPNPTRLIERANSDSVMLEGVPFSQTNVPSEILYAQGVRREHRFRSDFVTAYTAADPRMRWAGAAGLARLDGTAASPVLETTASEVSEPLERAVVLAALVHSGARHRIEDLHLALSEMNERFPVYDLLPVWKLELLECFRRVRNFDPRALQLWMEAMDCRPHELTFFDLLPVRNQIFISYARADEPWKDMINDRLSDIAEIEGAEVWDDSFIPSGERWEAEIIRRMHSSSVAIFILTSSFVNSDFIRDTEMPTFLRLHEERGVHIRYIVAEAGDFNNLEITQFQGANRLNLPLSAMDEITLEKTLDRFVTDIGRLMT